MKRTALTLITLSLVVSGSAVVGGPNPDDGLAITSSDGTSSATTDVGPNGTEYTSYFSVFNFTQANETGITDFSWNGDSFSFEGVYKAPSPCYELKDRVGGTEGVYTFDISAERTGNSTCAQVVTHYSYSANFTSDNPYQMNVTYDGESVESFEHPDFGEQDSDEPGLFSGLLSLILGLFS